jgi:hypothetical protein
MTTSMGIIDGANIVQTDEVTGSLDGRGPIVGGMTHDIGFDIYLKGSGAAGVAPDFDDVMQACAWASVLTAAPVPAAPEALAAGASQTQATLGASPVGTSQLYRGMPILFTGAVAGVAFISDYSVAKLAVLTDSMRQSHGHDELPDPRQRALQAGQYLYIDGVRWRFVGCRGSLQASLPVGGPPRISFAMQGLFVDETDAAVPVPTYDGSRPPVFRDAAGNGYTRMLVNHQQVALSTLGFDMGNHVALPENPNTRAHHPRRPVHRSRAG